MCSDSALLHKTLQGQDVGWKWSCTDALAGQNNGILCSKMET